MGLGGHVVLINGTKYTWKKTYSHTFQMNWWKFPEKLDAGTVQVCYIEWNQHIFKDQGDDKGECFYQLEGTNFLFQILASAKSGFHISIKYENFSNLGSNTIELGFDHNGFNPFSISGREGKFISTNSNASNWMSENLDLLGNRLLNDLCLPGSHDSGMSQIHSPTAFANAQNTQTQAVEMIDQLNLGIRYFDIRPIIGGGNFHTGHYSKVSSGWQGARGQSLESIIQQLNDFTSRHKELIILCLSHGLQTDLGNSNYRPLHQDEYERCLQQLKSINNLFISSNDPINLSEKPLNHFLGNGRSAVCIVLNDEVDLKSFYHQGFYPRNEWPIVDDYADSNKLDKMIDDQLNKLAKNRSGSKKNYFLISWTLTLKGAQNVFGPSIHTIAHAANTSLYRLILDSNFKSLIKKGFPNIITQDFVTSDNTAIAFAINFFKDDAFYINFRNEKGELLPEKELVTSSTSCTAKYIVLDCIALIIFFIYVCFK